MRRRTLLVVLLVVSTAAFVVGVSIERSSADTHDEPVASSEPGEAAESGERHAAEESEGEEAHPEERADATTAEADEESETFLGIDLEAAPFVALAAAFSIALAVGVWLRPAWGALLALIVVAMIAFAALDVREVLHQIDESKGGLAVLAGIVAVLHLAAAATAALMRRRSAAAPGDQLA